MGILAWIVLGGIAGWIATLIVKTSGSHGILFNIFIGVIGALVGGFVFNFFGAAGVTGFNLYSLLVAMIGAVIMLWIANFFGKSNSSPID